MSIRTFTTDKKKYSSGDIRKHLFYRPNRSTISLVCATVECLNSESELSFLWYLAMIELINGCLPLHWFAHLMHVCTYIHLNWPERWAPKWQDNVSHHSLLPVSLSDSNANLMPCQLLYYQSSFDDLQLFVPHHLPSQVCSSETSII